MTTLLRWRRINARRSLARWLVVAIGSAALAGCAMAPGMRLGEIPAESEAFGNDLPQESLKKITPELIRSERAANTTDVVQEVRPLFGSPTPYLIGSGDILSIVVWDHPEFSATAMTGAGAAAAIAGTGNQSSTDVGGTTTPGFVVDQDGLVQFPFAGQLKLAGLTEAQARNKLTQRLAAFLQKPEVTLRVQAYRSKRIYIDGEVKTPGIQSINDLPMTLTEAVSRAGGFTPNADQSRVQVSRAGTTYELNLPQLLQKGVNPSTILLANGDVVRVIGREESKVFVLGEVTRQTTLMLRNGKLTLNEALGDAGGLSQLSSEGRQVYVVRNAQDMHPLIYNLDARSPVALALAENFDLKAKDVVYVDAAPLANWSRVVGLILPSALLTVTSAASATK